MLTARERPIRDFLDEVAKITGKSLLIDPSVQGTVTLVIPGPLTKEEVWEVALGALSLNGYAAVERGALVKIVTKEKAASEPIPTLPETVPSDDEMITELIELRHVAADTVLESVRSLLGPGGRVAPAPGNVTGVIVVDTAANVGRIRAMLERIDEKRATWPSR
ncbi:MAG: hypothetical protein M5R36_02415 [Deltaproteobacteria bacterium]|nr:hypothetical protein [Deltaproteobacteria bacterium]